MKIKAISLWEPWASLIRTGAKQYETRSWATPYRGPLLICATKGGLDKHGLEALLIKPEFQKGLMPLLKPDQYGRRPGIKTADLLFGKVVAIVELKMIIKTDAVPQFDLEREKTFGDFTSGRWVWFLGNVRAIKPFPVKGKQGIFEVELPEGVRP